MFLYQMIDDHIQILGYLGYDGSIRIPETIEERPVTELAAYSFSDSPGRKEMLSSAGEEIRFCDQEGNPMKGEETADLPPEVYGVKLKEIHLPGSLKKIGNYAFYNCYEMTHVIGYSSIADLGSGLFTGCHGIRFLDFYMADGQRSCMKDMLSELPQELYVNYYSSQGNTRLVFPEMYEEAVEFTPARIISLEMHGCGHRYRYCFDKTDFQFHKYDALFPNILVQEPEQVVAALVLGRLYAPFKLLKQDKEVYEGYLREHFAGCVKLALKEDDSVYILWLSRKYAVDQKAFESIVDMANQADRPEVLSILMEERRKRFPAKKRTFSL